jgi:hypothetical protein
MLLFEFYRVLHSSYIKHILCVFTLCLKAIQEILIGILACALRKTTQICVNYIQATHHYGNSFLGKRFAVRARDPLHARSTHPAHIKYARFLHAAN